MIHSYRLCLFSFSTLSFDLIDIDQFLDHGSLNVISRTVSLISSDVIIFNIDPFSPLESISSKVIGLPNKSFAIVCDTHHGRLPLHRIVNFCLTHSVRHVNLRFNQRHTPFFTSFGIKVYNTIFSPDLSLFISSADYFFKLSSSLTRENKTLHCGSLSSQHHYRNSCIQGLTDSSNVINQRFSSVSSMLFQFFNYTSVLNVSLNLDFNRRIIEAGLCGCILVSDSLEDSQWQYPFSLFKPYIKFFSSKSSLLSTLSEVHMHPTPNFDFTKILLRFHYFRHDYFLRTSLLFSISNSFAPILPYASSSLLNDISHYDSLQESIRDGSIIHHFDHFKCLSNNITSEYSDSFLSLLSYGFRRWNH